MIGAGADAAWYVYGVVPADADAEGLARLDGVGGERVQLLFVGGLAAIVGRVALDEFGDEPLRRNLEDRGWLEETARAHDGVLSGALDATPLVPLRLGTVYRSEDSVLSMLRERESELQHALERVRGCVELGVKAFLLDTSQEESPPSSGREYLVQKQRARAASVTAQADAVESVSALHDRLVSLAVDARTNPPQPAELSGRDEPMLLNAAYLIRAERQPEFVAAVGSYGNERLELALTGPWPPYNFVDGDDAS